MFAGNEQLRLIIEMLGASAHLWHKLLAGVVAVGVHGEGSQRNEVDAVAFLERGEVGVAQRQPQNATHTSIVASGGAHPQHIVVAPGDIPRVVALEHIHDLVGAGSTVVDVAKDVELVNGQLLDDL